jgi:hypothetical protein
MGNRLDGLIRKVEEEDEKEEGAEKFRLDLTCSR